MDTNLLPSVVLNWRGGTAILSGPRSVPPVRFWARSCSGILRCGREAMYVSSSRRAFVKGCVKMLFSISATSLVEGVKRVSVSSSLGGLR